jgi:hypothetical protein
MPIKAIDARGREITDIDRVVVKAGKHTYHVSLSANGLPLIEGEPFHVRWRGEGAAELCGGARKAGTPVETKAMNTSGSGVAIIDYGGWSTGKMR